jgi:hypothetical protein
MSNNSDYCNNHIQEAIIHYLGIKSQDINNDDDIFLAQVKESYLKKIRRYPPHLFPHKFHLLDLCKEWMLCGPIFLESLFFHSSKNIEDYLYFIDNEDFVDHIHEHQTNIQNHDEIAYQYEQCFYLFMKNYITKQSDL